MSVRFLSPLACRLALLTAASLLIPGLATAQMAEPLSATAVAANADRLAWMVDTLLGAVAIVAVLAAIVLLTAAADKRSGRRAAPAAPAGAALPLAATAATAPAAPLPTAPVPQLVA